MPRGRGEPIGILSPRGLLALERLAAGRPLLAFDFDGTLSPLTGWRDAAQLPPSTRALLGALARMCPLAVISGRSRPDVLSRLAEVPAVAVIGNHGAEAGPDAPDPGVRRCVVAWADTLRAAFATAAGIEVEDKGFTLAVHYRHAPDPGEALRRLAAATGAFADARVTGGHAVLNVIPRELPTKGTVLETLAPALDCTGVLFAGDDVTDEDAFESRIVDVSVRVGRDPGSAAAYFLESQGHVDALLAALVAARSRTIPPPPIPC